MSIDRSNPLHQASFYVEALKYGPGSRRLERVGEDEFCVQLERIIADTRTDATPEQLIEAFGYYGDSFAEQLNLSPLVAKSIFVDGVLHGMALAGGLHGQPEVSA